MDVGNNIPSCAVLATNEAEKNLQDYRGKWLVLYFYPKDATPGCTLEGQDFRDHYADYLAKNAVIRGVSRDSLKSHDQFKTKQCFPFDLISDHDEKLCQLFDVIKMKSMYGKQSLGIERSTFLIDPDGVVRHIWRKVNVKGHVAEVLETLTRLQQ